MSEPRKLEFYYIRHADTSGASFADRDRCDVDITPLGEQQAALLGERFAGRTFDAVLCSPLVRCVRTAAAVCNRLAERPVIEVVPELIEKGSTENYPGCPLFYLTRYYDALKKCPDHIFGTAPACFPNVTDEDADARAAALVQYLKKRFAYGQRVLLVSHGSFANHFLPAAVEMGAGNYILSINNTSVSKVKYTDDGKQRISFCNDFSHLRPLMPDYEFTV